MQVGTVAYQSAQNFSQVQAAPTPAVAAFNARTVVSSPAQTEQAARSADHTNRNQEARESRKEYKANHVDRGAKNADGNRGRRVDVTV